MPGPRVKATAFPDGENVASFASSNGRRFSCPPSAGTEYRPGAQGKEVLRVDWNTTFFPSGVQPTTTSCAESKVSRFGFPPYAGLTNTSYCPCRLDEKAIDRPSGLKTG